MLRLGKRRVLEEGDYGGGAALHAVDEDAALVRPDLERDAAGVPADDGSPLPEDLRDVSPKPSRRDFWTITSTSRWKAFTSREPMPVWFVSRWQSSSAAVAACACACA